jgi:hypothetical protein
MIIIINIELSLALMDHAPYYNRAQKGNLQ